VAPAKTLLNVSISAPLLDPEEIPPAMPLVSPSVPVVSLALVGPDPALATPPLPPDVADGVTEGAVEDSCGALLDAWVDETLDDDKGIADEEGFEDEEDFTDEEGFADEECVVDEEGFADEECLVEVDDSLVVATLTSFLGEVVFSGSWYVVVGDVVVALNTFLGVVVVFSGAS